MTILHFFFSFALLLLLLLLLSQVYILSLTGQCKNTSCVCACSRNNFIQPTFLDYIKSQSKFRTLIHKCNANYMYNNMNDGVLQLLPSTAYVALHLLPCYMWRLPERFRYRFTHECVCVRVWRAPSSVQCKTFHRFLFIECFWVKVTKFSWSMEFIKMQC